VGSIRGPWSSFAAGALLAGLTAVLLAGNGGSAVAASRVVVPTEHPWGQAHVVTVQSTQAPVGLPGTPYAFAVKVASISPTSRTGRLVRIDLETGQVAKGPELLSASDLLVIGRSLAVVSPSGIAPDGVAVAPFHLRLVAGDGTALGPGVELAWAGATGSLIGDDISPTDGGLWLPTPEGAELVSITSGTALKSLSLGARVSDVAPSPDGKLLYVALDELWEHPAAKVGTVIDEVDAITGRVVAHQGIDFTVGPASLTPVQGGVWASYRQGMAGTAGLYRSEGLALVVPGPLAQSPVPRYGDDVTMGLEATLLGGTLWLQSATGISCLVPSTGTFLAGTAFQSDIETGDQSWAPFAAWDGLVYALSAEGIVVVRPAAACG
jgi:hypothetical protein